MGSYVHVGQQPWLGVELPWSALAGSFVMLLDRTNRHRMHYSFLVGAPVLVLYGVFIQPEGTFHRLKSPDD